MFKLPERCKMCGNYDWCGRPCAHSPKAEPEPKDNPVMAPKSLVKAYKKEYGDTFQGHELKALELIPSSKPKRDRKEYMREFMRQKRIGLKRKPKEAK